MPISGKGKKDLDLENRVEKTGVTKVAGLESPDNKTPATRGCGYTGEVETEKKYKKAPRIGCDTLYLTPSKNVCTCAVSESQYSSLSPKRYES